MSALRVLGKLALGFAILLLAYLLVATGARLWPLSAKERADLALMEQPAPPVAGRDGSDAAWLQDHDVPPGERQAVARELRAYYLDRADDLEPVRYADAVLKRFPKFEGSAPLGDLCGVEDRCLPDVRAHPQQADAIVASQWRRVVVGMDMANYDGVRHGIGMDPASPVMPLAYNGRVVQIYRAREFIAGRRQQAFEGVCRDLAGWRRISSNADSLIANMIGLSMVRQNSLLLADMLAELPAGEDLPTACAAALGATTDAELDSCPAMQYESRFASHMINQPSKDETWSGNFGLFLVDRRRFAARHAQALSAYCGAAVRAEARAGRSVAAFARSNSCSTLRKVVDPFGCMLSEISGTDHYIQYVDRRTDVAVLLAGVRTAAWLRAQGVPPADRAKRVHARPASLGLVREPVVSADGMTITLPMLSHWRGDEIVLRLGGAEGARAAVAAGR